MAYDQESSNPCEGQNTTPRSPSDNSVTALVSCALEDTEEDEASRHRSVENTQEDQGWNHEGERDLLHDFVAERSKGWGSYILVSRVCVHDGSNDTEDENFGNSDCPESLGEILGIPHLGDETWNGDLANECVGDVQESVHSSHESYTLDWNSCDDGISQLSSVTCWVGLDPSEDCSQKDGNESEEC